MESLRVELITVGHELLTGSTVNTNASWIGMSLSKLGLTLSRITVVDDRVDEICSSLNEAISRKSSFIIFVGGLGPTHDDITLEAIAKCIGKKLVLNKDALHMIREYYRERKLKLRMTKERLKMAMLPEGSIPLRNRKGTAPGIQLGIDNSLVFCLPGVPREMRSIFNTSIKKIIIERIGTIYRERKLVLIEGIPESSLAPFIRKLQKSYPEAYVKSHPKGYHEGISRLVLELDMRASDKEKLERRLEEMISTIKDYIKNKGGNLKVIGE
jgi:nicotinamide-nucleotide amidase